jgi:hypothetical protein
MPYIIKKKTKGGSNSVGTSGDLGTLINDITTLATQTITTVTDTVGLINYVMNIDTTLGESYSPNETNAPGNNFN